MSVLSVISSGFVMGLSASVVCLGWCVPVIMPYTAAASRPGILAGFITSSLFSAGRLASYLLLMGIFLAFRALVPISPAFGSIATLISGIILVLSGLMATGAIKWRSGLAGFICGRIAGTSSPLYLGALTGLRPCGPLLAAMAFMLSLPTPLGIGVFMICFWAASSLLVIILGAVGGGLSVIISRKLGIDRFRGIIGVAMVCIGIFLVLTGVGGIRSGAV